VTSSYLGIAVLDVLLLAAGLAVLWGLGFVRTAFDAFRHAGLALVVGWVSVGIAASVALVLGAPLARWLLVLLAVGIGMAGVLLARRVPARRLGAVGERGPAVWIAVSGAALLAIQLAALLRSSVGGGAPTEWDAWAFWLPKARALVEQGGLDSGEGGFTSFAHPEYPPLAAVFEGSAFSFMGSTGATALAVHHWIVAFAFFGSLATLLAVRVRPAVLWPSLAFLALLPVFGLLIGSSLGDEPLMLLLGLAAASAALWLLEREPRYAALTALFLAGVALAKSEGLPISLVLAGTMLVLLWRRPLVPALVLLAPVAALVPWKLWLRANDVPASPDYRLSDVFRPSVLADRLDRLSYAAGELPAYVFDPGLWLLAVPLMLAAVVLAAPRRPALSVLALVPVAAIPAGLLLVYWIGFPPVDWYVATSAARGVASAVVLAAVFLPLLLAEASRR